jgi:hypothetical protein
MAKLLQIDTAAFDPSLNARVLHALVTGYPFDLMQFYPKLHQFFTEFFSLYSYVKYEFVILIEIKGEIVKWHVR